jgi:large subunit ribosomal protein L18
MLKKQVLRAKRKQSIRKKISGTSTTPRVSIFRSNKYLYVQVIDDTKSVTLASADSKGTESLSDVIYSQLSKLGVDSIVFDRSGYKYHGNIRKFAEELRGKGIKF